jgi:hypothetical protein
MDNQNNELEKICYKAFKTTGAPGYFMLYNALNGKKKK